MFTLRNLTSTFRTITLASGREVVIKSKERLEESFDDSEKTDELRVLDRRNEIVFVDVHPPARGKVDDESGKEEIRQYVPPDGKDDKSDKRSSKRKTKEKDK